MNHILAILWKIKDRYALYIGRKSIDELVSFLNGYICAVEQLTGKYTQFNCRFQQFIEVKERLRNDEARHWGQILRENRTQEDAFDLFYVYLEEFETIMNHEKTWEQISNEHLKRHL